MSQPTNQTEKAPTFVVGTDWWLGTQKNPYYKSGVKKILYRLFSIELMFDIFVNNVFVQWGDKNFLVKVPCLVTEEIEK